MIIIRFNQQIIYLLSRMPRSFFCRTIPEDNELIRRWVSFTSSEDINEPKYIQVYILP